MADTNNPTYAVAANAFAYDWSLISKTPVGRLIVQGFERADFYDMESFEDIKAELSKSDKKMTWSERRLIDLFVAAPEARIVVLLLKQSMKASLLSLMWMRKVSHIRSTVMMLY